MKSVWKRMAVLVACGVSAWAAGVKIVPGNMSPYSKTNVGAKIYTPPDPGSMGGIRGRIEEAPSPVLGVVAVYEQFPNVSALGDVDGGRSAKNAKNVNQDMKQPVYLASLDDNNNFSFTGLPPGKYDLLVMCENCFYEGINLSREPDTLTADDRKSIQAKMKESIPFFNVKNQHRIEGQTGSFGKALILDQEVRTLPVTLQSAETLKNIQIRSMKICFMESVGTQRLGTHWELKKSRELVRQELGPPETKGVIPGYFMKKLQGIRVSTREKDLGTIVVKPDPKEDE